MISATYDAIEKVRKQPYSDMARLECLDSVLKFAAMLMLIRSATAFALGFSLNMWVLLIPMSAIAASLFLAERGFPRLAALGTCYALYRIGAFAITQFMFSALVLGRSFPIADATLSQADLSLHLDWIAFASFDVAHPALDFALRFAYNSIYCQPLLIVTILVAQSKFQDAFALLSAILLGIMVASLIALMVPAYGAVNYYGFQPGINFETANKMAETIDWLRSSTQRPPSCLYFGLISFPSFHAFSAILFIWSSRNIRYLLAFSVPLNAALLCATPIQGSHYFVDVLAGLFLSPRIAKAPDAALKATFP